MHRKGIANSIRGVFTTFEEELRIHGHVNRDINFLKMDVEGAERESLVQILESGALKNVHQVSFEWHDLNKGNIDAYWHIFQGLYKQGFKLLIREITEHKEQVDLFHTYFETTYRKTKTPCNFDV